jgi:hypothetical protein
MKKIMLFLVLGLLLASFAAADKFKCTDDCPPPEAGYVLIGCTTVKNYAVTHDEGTHIPAQKPWNAMGYVYVQSYTERDAEGNVVVDEIIACDYWPVNQTLPPTEEELHPEWFDDEDETEAEEMAGDIGRYNENVEYFPGFVKSLFGDGLLHVHYTKADGEVKEYAAVTADSMVVESSTWIDKDEDGNDDKWQEHNEQANMNVYVDEATVDDIEESEDPMATFMDAWGNEIRYEGITFGSKVKTTLVNVGMWFVDLFV